MPLEIRLVDHVRVLRAQSCSLGCITPDIRGGTTTWQHDRDGPYIAQGSGQGNRTESACTWIYFQGKHTTGSTTWQNQLIGLHLQTFSLLIQDAAN